MNNNFGWPTTGTTFTPFLEYISAIVQGQTTALTFTEDHRFSVGEYVSFRVSKNYGMIQLNNQRGLVLAITSDTITVDIDSSNYTPYIYPADNPDKIVFPAVAVPAGSGIIPNSNPRTVNLQDCFDNVPD